jgi:ADP-heptose:LPS heptosyltransferase
MRLKALEKRGKRAILALIGPLLRDQPVDPKALTDRRYDRVLVVRQDERLGNVILITPFLEALRNVLPGAHISVLVSDRFGDVLLHNPHADEIISFDKRQFLHNPLRFVRFIRKLRTHRFDLAVDCGPADGLSLNNALMTYLSAAPVRLGYLRGQSDIFLNVLVPRRALEGSEIDHHLDLLRFCFGEVRGGRIKVYLSPQERQGAAEMHRRWGLHEENLMVGMHIGGRGQKRWPMERFLRLAQMLIANYGAKVVLFWGPGERQEIDSIRGDLAGDLFLAPALGIRELAGHLERCNVFISVDTGPMHLALAVGTPTVAIFQVPNYVRYGDQGPRNRIVHRPDGDVREEDVLEVFADLLSALRVEGGGSCGC